MVIGLMEGIFGLSLRTWPSPDQGEIADARWYSRADVRAALATKELLLPPEVSIARKLVDAWLNEE